MFTASVDLSNGARTALFLLNPFDGSGDIEITPVKAPFTPSKGLVLSTLPAADFAGSTPLVAEATPVIVFTDPVDSKLKMRIPEPAGGWNWGTTSGLNLPQTISGVKITSIAYPNIGSARLPADVILTASGQSFGIGDLIVDLSTVNLSSM